MKSFDVGELARFATTGFIVAVVYVALHSVLATQIAPLASNMISFCLAVGVQYVLQTSWTFRRDIKDRDQAVRFAFVIAVGLTYSSIMTAFVGPLLDVSATLSAGFVAVTLPFLNFIAFRLWVYT